MQNMKRFFVLMFCLLGSMLMFESCCNCGRRSAEPIDLKGVTWRLIELNGKVVPDQSDTTRYTVILSESGELNGRGDCNSYFGRFVSEKEGELTLSPDGATKAMCPDMKRETEFLEMMPRVKSFKIDGNILMLFDSEGKLIAALRRV